MCTVFLSACTENKTAFFDSSVVPKEKFSKPTKQGRIVRMGENVSQTETVKEKEFGPSFDFDKLR